MIRGIGALRRLAPLSIRAFSRGIEFVGLDGKSTTLALEEAEHVQHLAGKHGIELGVCGGEQTCGRCHVYVDQHDKLEASIPVGEDEQETLKLRANEPKENSRLCCGISPISSELDGLVLTQAPLKELKTKKKKEKKKKVQKESMDISVIKAEGQSQRQLADGIEWCGVVDWNLRDFHDFEVKMGGTYNSYLIHDEQTVLIDTVKSTFFLQHAAMLPDKIDKVVVNHAEMDHSSGLPLLMERFHPTVVTNKKCKGILSKMYDTSDWTFEIVKSGDTMNIGSRTLQFLTTPMAHWPDSMMTYDQSSKILFSMDAFGQHHASNYRFDDREDLVPFSDVLNDAKLYYANILMGLGSHVAAGVDAALEMFPEISLVAPSHGVIWKKHIGDIVGAYSAWAACKPAPKVTICYDSMYESTSMMADAFYEGACSIPDVDVRLLSIRKVGHSTAVTEMLDSAVVGLGSPTMHSGMMPAMGSLLTSMKGLFPSHHGKEAFIFGSYGWEPAGVEAIEHMCEVMELPRFAPPTTTLYRPNEKTLSQCCEIGRQAAEIATVKGKKR